ncbi:MAG: tetratricopeptide repeat protein, partial [Acidimicrobiia bacterium]
ERLSLRDQALPIYEEIGDLLGQGNVLTNVGIDLAREGRWEEALVLWDRGRDAFDRAGDVVGAAGMTHNIGEQLANLGRLEEAEARQREARRVWTAARYSLGAAAATSGLGRTLARSGRDEEAIALLGEALDTFGRLGRALEVIETEARIVEAHSLAGRWQDALDLADMSLARAVGDEYVEYVAAMHRDRGRALHALGDTTAAEAAFECSLSRAREAALDLEIAATLATRASLRAGAEAESDRAEARRILDAMGATRNWLDLST